MFFLFPLITGAEQSIRHVRTKRHFFIFQWRQRLYRFTAYVCEFVFETISKWKITVPLYSTGESIRWDRTFYSWMWATISNSDGKYTWHSENIIIWNMPTISISESCRYGMSTHRSILQWSESISGRINTICHYFYHIRAIFTINIDSNINGMCKYLFWIFF